MSAEPGPRLLVRTDWGSRIGTGHVMRCLALAQAWIARGGDVSFLTATPSEEMRLRILGEGASCARISGRPGSPDDARETVMVSRQNRTDWIVVDGYHFREEYQHALKTGHGKSLLIDDYGHAGHYSTDLVLNQNLYASTGLYASRDPDTELLLGPRYVLLRKEFLPWKEWTRTIPRIAKNILVSLGGGDQGDATALVLRALQEIPRHDLEIRAIIGPSGTHGEMIRGLAKENGHPVEVLSDVTDMPGLMAWADLAISGGGSSCYEIAFMGLPGCIVITAENQVPLATSLADLGISVNAGWYHSCTSSSLAGQILNLMEHQRYRREMSTRQRRLLDGMGASRVAGLMMGGGEEKSLPQTGDEG
ncbi:MAG: UDP-2,4-diacetamido-2,4,6-trideoxy-beta-L-altropyranose hydrolase [Methanomicrobiales archaeon]|nr:UDP-2,4-diacetamido-2,4,6-trideoxy-beta-L-altropyranose hydrolase [Methanomicrobiales archaeon]